MLNQALSTVRDLCGPARSWQDRELLELPTIRHNDPRPDLRSEVLQLLREGCETPWLMASLVPRLWLRLAPKPLEHVTAGQWRRLFRAAGYSEDARPAHRPTTPVRLYRGGSPNGWSWTDHELMAVTVATNGGDRPAEGFTWTTLAPPASLLGRVPFSVSPRTGDTLADEFIVDPALLDEVRPWTAEEIAAVRPLRIQVVDGFPVAIRSSPFAPFRA